MTKGRDFEAPAHNPSGRVPRPEDARHWLVRSPLHAHTLKIHGILIQREGAAIFMEPAPPFDTLWIFSMFGGLSIQQAPEEDENEPA